MSLSLRTSSISDSLTQQLLQKPYVNKCLEYYAVAPNDYSNESQTFYRITDPKLVQLIANRELSGVKINKDALHLIQVFFQSQRDLNKGDSSFRTLPPEILGNILNFLISPDNRTDLVPLKTIVYCSGVMQQMNKAISTRYATFGKNIPNVDKKNISGSVAATVWKKLGLSNESPPYLARTTAGMTFYVTQKDHGERFTSALNNHGYAAETLTGATLEQPFCRTDKNISYTYSVTFTDLTKLMHFIRTIGGCSLKNAGLFFKAHNLPLTADFLEYGLKQIGQSLTRSSELEVFNDKKNEAENFLETFLPCLSPAEAKKLLPTFQTLCSIADNASALSPLQFIKAKTSIAMQVLSAPLFFAHDGTTTYKNMQKAIMDRAEAKQ